MIVNENYTCFHQLAMIKACMEERYKDYVVNFKKSNYYSSFYGKKILNLLDKYSVYDLLSTNIINTIAFMAMNIDVSKLNSDKLLDYTYISKEFIEKSYKFNPNERYVCLLKALEKLLEENDIKEITEQMLVEKSGLNIIENSKDNVLYILELYKKQFETRNIDAQIINNNIKEVKKIKDDDFIIKEVSEQNVYNMFDFVRPRPLNNNYKVTCIEKFNVEYLQCNVMKIMIKDNKYEQVILYDTFMGKEYIFISDKSVLTQIINKFNNNIIIYAEDYEEIINRFPTLKNRTIFLEINNHYNKCKEFINGNVSSKKETMIIQFNDGIFFVFLKQKDGNIFVMYFLEQVINILKKDINEGLFNLISLDNEKLDNCFYNKKNDWSIYEHIMRSIMGIYAMDREHVFKDFGIRVES